METQNNRQRDKSPAPSKVGITLQVPDEEIFIAFSNMRMQKKSSKETTFLRALSAMYAKLIVVVAFGLFLSPILSPHMPYTVNQGICVYLYVVSILFLIYSFTVHSNVAERFVNLCRCIRRPQTSENNNFDDNRSDKVNMGYAVDSRNYGSFYLRVGAMVFGIGSMIYSGLEAMQYVEMKGECLVLVAAVNHFTHLIFTFMQMYFVFVNSKMSFHRHQSIGFFGLMHLVATNLCVWMKSILEEVEHEILLKDMHLHRLRQFLYHTADEDDLEMDFAEDDCYEIPDFYYNGTTAMPVYHRRKRSLIKLGDNCLTSDVFKALLGDISPFLFPCNIEYSLICAAICYIMWKHAGQKRLRHASDSMSDVPFRKHQYSVDCSHATKGLFSGIMVIVMSIISVILFFVLIHKDEHFILAIEMAFLSELILLLLAIVAVTVALIKVRRFQRVRHKANIELDSILLILGQGGLYMLSIFSIIAGHFTQQLGNANLVLILASSSRLLQATLQTIFIFEASQRNASNVQQAQKKPGREMITFLLVCNFALWIITSLATGRHDSNLVQVSHFGFWGWTTIARVSIPLSIFYRFHSTVCLCDIWKKLYKLKPEPL